MESLAYYESEDEQEIENSIKTRDVSLSPMNKQRVEVSSLPSSSHVVVPSSVTSNKKKLINYDNIQMDLSEDSDGSGVRKNQSNYKKTKISEIKEKYVASGHGRYSDDEKETKISEQQKDRDYEKRAYNKTNNRERLNKNRYRDDRSAPDRYRRDNKSRSDKDESFRDRDKSRNDKNRDRDRFRDRGERHRDRGDYERDRDRAVYRSNQSSDKYKERNQSYDKYKERDRIGEIKGRDRERPTSTKEFNKRRSISPREDKKERKSSTETCSPIRSTPIPLAPSSSEATSNSLVVTALPLDTTSNNINLSFIEKRKEKVQQLEKMGIDIKSATIKPGVELPSYYNPGVINPTKYADQVQKRKLLWSHKKNEQEQAAAKWETAKFSQDQDGKVASKFMRLMGIKDAPPKPTGESSKNQDLTKKQEELFSTMEQQYEVARQVTHTMRGVGLGFGSQPRQF